MHFRYFYLLIGWMILIFIASSIPGTSLPPLDIWSADKWIHSGVFGVLAFFSFQAFRHYGQFKNKTLTWTMACSLALCLVYGISDETHQMVVPNRDASAFDFMADAIGIAAVHGYCFFRKF
jgi:VanZ family protein